MMVNSGALRSVLRSLLLLFWGTALQNGYAAKCPCDIYTAGGTPCVAAHSTVRALYAEYNGPLYQVRRTSDGKLLDIGLRNPGGYVNAVMQDTFLNGKAGTISKIYDQSPNKNDLTKSPVGGFLHNGGLEANATAAKATVNGYPAYGVRTTSSWDNEVGSVGYRNNKTTGVAVKNQPEGIYMVCSGKVYNEWCCFDYGNAQTDNTADAAAIMETVYFGNSKQWGSGSGEGPWVMADLEWGLFAGGALVNSANTPIVADYVTGVVKGDSTNRYAIRGCDAVTGKLKTMYSGPRPNGYYPMKKEGAIVLGVGGDNSHTGQGVFFEGAITTGYPSDATEDSIQANIVAAGYGRGTTAIARHGAASTTAAGAPEVQVGYHPAIGAAFINCMLAESRQVTLAIFDQQGRNIATIINNRLAAGRHRVVWDIRHVPAGVYLWRFSSEGMAGSCGSLVIGK
jgi:hypothetical protein